jgi:hypothetical protein
MGGACSTHVRNVKCIHRTQFYFENLKGRDNLGDLSADGTILIKRSLRVGEDVDWIHVAQDRDS